jgi:leader peptidase (prepilin peptidase)/N-methyltransferase
MRHREREPATRSEPDVAIVMGTGVLFAAMSARIGADADLAAFLLLAAALVVLTVIDVRHLLLPDRVVLPVAGASVALLGVAAVAESAGDAWVRGLACAGGMLVVFSLLHAASPRALGFGDVKLSFVLGADLGWLGVGEVVLGAVLAFVYAAVAGTVLLVTRVRGRRDDMPFGPFLAAGTVTAVLAGDAIIDWYTG